MPDEAPVMKTFDAIARDPRARALSSAASSALALGARLRHELGDRGRQVRVGAHAIRRRHELAVDDDRRHALDVILLRELHRALDLAVDRERREHFLDLLPVEALARCPVEELVLVGEVHVLLMDRLEYLRREL